MATTPDSPDAETKGKRAGSWREEVVHAAIGLRVGFGRDHLLYGKKAYASAYPALSLQELGLKQLGFQEVPIKSSKPEKEERIHLGLWCKEASSPAKPVYVLMHGRADRLDYHGALRKDMRGRFDPGYRVEWLKEMANNGAGVIAVHTRGFGRSGDTGVARLSPEGFRQDMKAIADYIKQQNISPQRVVIVGESMGGAMAGLLAEEMVSRGQPPAMLALVNTFDKISHVFRDHVHKANFLGWEFGKGMTAEKLQKYIGHKMDPITSVEMLDPTKTKLYIAHAPADRHVGIEHAEQIYAAAEKKQEGWAQFRRLEGKYLVKGGERLAHTGWNPEEIRCDLESMLRGESISAYAPEKASLFVESSNRPRGEAASGR